MKYYTIQKILTGFMIICLAAGFTRAMRQVNKPDHSYIAGPGTVVQLHNRCRPNNQYELLCYPDHYVLKDGKRYIAIIPCNKTGAIDSLIVTDNQ